MAYPLADGTSIRSHPLLPTQKRTLHRIFLILHADLPRRARRPHGLAVDLGPRGAFRCRGAVCGLSNSPGRCPHTPCLSLPFHAPLYPRPPSSYTAVALGSLPPPPHS